MNNTARSIFGAYLQTCQLVGLPFVLAPNTTLNEKLNIQANLVPAANDMPHMRYVAIGNGGHRMQAGADGMAIPKPIQHRSTDAELFNHLPFVLRDLANDLTAQERVNYGLRRIETHDGNSYIAYYLKRLDLSAVVPKMEYNAVANDTTTTTVFVPNSSNLNPTPPAINNSGANTVTGDFVTASAKIPFLFTSNDVDEYLNVCRVIYGSEDYAIISEIALCSGLDRTVSVSSVNSGTFNFNEVIAAQVVSFISTFTAMQFTRDGLNMAYDCGATEPLFLLNA